MTLPKKTAEQRFFEHVAPALGLECWLWTAGTRYGYGHFADGRQHIAHRWAYRFLRGDIPEGLALDHLCRTPACVNPWHMEPVTWAENNRRAVKARLGDACGRGHPRSESYVRSNGKHQCRACIRENHRAKAVDPEYRAELARKQRERGRPRAASKANQEHRRRVGEMENNE